MRPQKAPTAVVLMLLLTLGIGAERSASAKCSDLYASLGHFLAGEGRIVHTWNEPWSQKLQRGLAELGGSLVNFLWPLPNQIIWQPTDAVFTKQWKDPGYSPTLQEVELLDRYRAREKFESRGNYLRTHPEWLQFRRGIKAAKETAIGSALFLSFLNAYQAEAHAVSGESFLTEPAFTLKANQIQLINEGQVPHLAIRIDHTVYSYGLSHLTSTSDYIYFSAPGAQTLFDRMSRQMQIVTLNLTKDQVLSLRRDLEKSREKIYYNVTAINDCSTMAIRALRRNTDVYIPTVIDAFPGEVMLYFGAKKLLGEERVAGFFQVKSGTQVPTKRDIARVAYFNFLESRFAINSWLAFEGSRVAIDILVREKDLQRFEASTLKEFSLFDLEVRKQVENDLEIQAIEQLLARRVPDAKSILELAIDERIKKCEDTSNNQLATLDDILFQEHLAQAWKNKRIALLHHYY